MPRKATWSLEQQLAAEKPRRPHVPECCPQCGCRWYYRDEDDDWLCLMCARTLVVWSVYRFEMRKWRAALASASEQRESYPARGPDGRYLSNGGAAA